MSHEDPDSEDCPSASWETELRRVSVPEDLHARLLAIAETEELNDPRALPMKAVTPVRPMGWREITFLAGTLAAVLLLAFRLNLLIPDPAVRYTGNPDLVDRGSVVPDGSPILKQDERSPNERSLATLLAEKEKLAAQRRHLLDVQLGYQKYQVRRVLSHAQPRPSRIVDEALKLGRGLGLNEEDLLDLNRSLALETPTGR